MHSQNQDVQNCNNISITIVSTPIPHAEITDSVRSHQAGAVVLFLGTVREMTTHNNAADSDTRYDANCNASNQIVRQTVSLDYEAHTEMAITTLQKIADAAKQQYQLFKLAIVHRIGHLELGEICVAIAASSAHRKEAFQATSQIMEQIKEVVPIWKKENWADGTTEWVHPGITDSTNNKKNNGDKK